MDDIHCITAWLFFKAIGGQASHFDSLSHGTILLQRHRYVVLHGRHSGGWAGSFVVSFMSCSHWEFWWQFCKKQHRWRIEPPSKISWNLMTSEKINSNHNQSFKKSSSMMFYDCSRLIFSTVSHGFWGQWLPEKSFPGDLANAAGESHVDDVFRGHMVRYHCLVGRPRKQLRLRRKCVCLCILTVLFRCLQSTPKEIAGDLRFFNAIFRI